MDFQNIKNEKEYQDLLKWVDAQFDLNVNPESTDGENLKITLRLIKQYEDLHYTIPSPIELSKKSH